MGSNNEELAPYLSENGEGRPKYEEGTTELNHKYGWTVLHALFTAEQIYHSRGTADPTWARTAGEIAYEHRWFIMDQPWRDPPGNGFNCDYYGDEFITLMEDTLKEHGEDEYDICPPRSWW